MDGCGFAKTHSGIDHVYAIRSSRLREWRDATAFTRYHVMRIACSLALASPACGPTYVEPLSEFFFSRRRLAAYAPPPVASASRIRDRIIQRNVPRGAQSEKEKKRRNLVSCMYCTCIYIYIYIYIHNREFADAWQVSLNYARDSSLSTTFRARTIQLSGSKKDESTFFHLRLSCTPSIQRRNQHGCMIALERENACLFNLFEIMNVLSGDIVADLEAKGVAW